MKKWYISPAKRGEHRGLSQQHGPQTRSEPVRKVEWQVAPTKQVDRTCFFLIPKDGIRNRKEP